MGDTPPSVRFAPVVLRLFTLYSIQLGELLGKRALSIPQFHLLSSLSAGPRMMTDIARHMRHTTAASTGLVDRLERGGMVVREPDPGDRRKVMVRILPAGSELLALVAAHMQALLMDEVFDHLSEADTTTLTRQMEELLGGKA